MVGFSVKKKNFYVLGGAGVLLLTIPPALAQARQTMLAGSVAMGQEYDSNIFEEDRDRQGRWVSSLAPALTLTSEGEQDILSLAVNSDLSWDQRLDDHDFSHGLALSLSREISQRLKVNLTNNYSYNDMAPERDMEPDLSLNRRFQRADAYAQTEVARLLFPEFDYDPDRHYLQVLAELDRRYDQAAPAVQLQVDRYLSNTDSRRRQWDNELAVGAEYEFARDSIISLGYRYFVNDDRTSGLEGVARGGGYFDEYDEHSPYVGLSYRFNPQWAASIHYQFTKAQHDVASDLTENDTLLNLDYTVSQTDRFSASYGWITSRYTGLQDDMDEQTAMLAWNHDFNPRLRLTTSLDGSYLAREDLSGDEREFGLDVGLSRLLQRGSLAIRAEATMAEAKEEGSWDDLRQSWGLDGAITWNLRENLTGSVTAAYEKRYQWQLVGDKATYDDYEAGIGLSYTFWRWFSLSCRYTYSTLDSSTDLIPDYHEHLVVVSLSAAKELMRW